MGRRSKLLTAATMERLQDALTTGNTIANACAMAGLGKTTFYRWLQEAENAPEGHELREFRDTIKRAMALAVHRAVVLIQKAAEKDWRAAAWWLERMNPKEWGRKPSIIVRAAPPIPAALPPKKY